MPVPKEELPDTDVIARLARCQLPAHYQLLDVRCEISRDPPDIIPNEFEVVIEYVTKLDEIAQGSWDAIKAHQDWANPLIEQIRLEWPVSTLRICFRQVASDNSLR
jgi:hypothetical protein